MNPLPTPPAPEKAGPSNLRQRLISGAIGATGLLGCVWLGPVTFGLFFAATQAVMLKEFYRMMRACGYKPAAWIGIITSLYIFGATAYLKFYLHASLATLDFATSGSSGWHTVILPFALVFGPLVLLPTILLIREMVLWPRYKSPFSNVGTTLAGLLYVSLPMCLLIGVSYNSAFLSNSPSNILQPHLGGYDYRRVVCLLFLIWASDIGAYAAGRTFGKHKLAPNISPGKTWEGWAGGALLTLLIAWALGNLIPDLSLTHRLVAAAVVAVFGPLGDLAESMLKRSAGVKDSGTFLPGHGGLLDRFDAFLLVLPVLALLQLLAGQ